MMDIKVLSTRLFKLLDVHRNTNKLGFSQDDIVRYVTTLTMINSQPRYTTLFNNHNLGDYVIPKPLMGLILPDSVTVTGAVTDVDFLQRPVPPAGAIALTLNEFNDLSYTIAAAFRKSGDGVAYIERPQVLLHEIIHKTSFKDQVKDLADPFFPIPLTVPFINTKTLTKSVEDMLNDALRDSLLQYRSASSK